MQCKLEIEDKIYEDVKFEIHFDQAVDEHLYPTDRPKGGEITIYIPTDVTSSENRHDYDYFMIWMLDSKMRKDGSIEYYSGDDPNTPAFTIKFSEAYCIGYHLSTNFEKKSESSVETIRISAKLTELGSAVLDKYGVWRT